MNKKYNFRRKKSWEFRGHKENRENIGYQLPTSGKPTRLELAIQQLRDLDHSAQLWLDSWAELGKTIDIDPSKLSLATTSYLAGCQPRNKLSGWLEGIGNKAQLRSANLELGLGLSLAQYAILRHTRMLELLHFNSLHNTDHSLFYVTTLTNNLVSNIGE